MKNNDEWGPWIGHDGSGCPCSGEYVHANYRDGSEIFGIAGDQCRANNVCPHTGFRSAWTWCGKDDEVVCYRVRKPRGMVVLEGLMQDLPQEEDA